MADWGVCRRIKVQNAELWEDGSEHGGNNGENFATSLATENVVSAPRVISNCLPISTISMSFVGFESRSTMLPASFAACVPVFHGNADVGLS